MRKGQEGYIKVFNQPSTFEYFGPFVCSLQFKGILRIYFLAKYELGFNAKGKNYFALLIRRSIFVRVLFKQCFKTGQADKNC